MGLVTSRGAAVVLAVVALAGMPAIAAPVPLSSGEGRAVDGPRGPIATALAVPAPPPPPEPDAWAVELALSLQPDQRQTYPCNVNLDCLSASQWFVAGGLIGTFVRPDVFSASVALGLGHAEDFEERPRGGFSVATLRGDLQVELGRTRDRFGAALRVTQVVALGWSSTGSGLASDIPGLTLILGQRDLWGEVSLPTLPTELDPRVFYAGVGWRREPFVVEGGLAQLGSLGYQHDALDRATGTLGLWASVRWRVSGPWELTARLGVSYPFMMVVGVAYRVARPR